MPDELIQLLPERVLFRIVKGDAKGRPFGTPRNPRAPTIEEFNPRLEDVRVGDLQKLIAKRRHGIFPEQAERIAQLDNEALTEFRPEDPISATLDPTGLSLTGGHHRTNEIINRVGTGQLEPSIIVKVLIHD
jgi:hypothetical protein